MDTHARAHTYFLLIAYVHARVHGLAVCFISYIKCQLFLENLHELLMPRFAYGLAAERQKLTTTYTHIYSKVNTTCVHIHTHAYIFSTFQQSYLL